MKSKAIQIVADVGDMIKVPALELTGRVRAILIDSEGVQYKISYFHDGRQETAYVFSDEINPGDRY